MASGKLLPKCLKLFVFGIAFSTLYSSCTPCITYRPKWIEHPAQICIERPEESGYVNIAGSNVVIMDSQIIRLVGNQAACAYVWAGDYFVYAQSHDPYDSSNPNPQAWNSETLRFNLKPGEKVELVVCKSGYKSRSQWVLKYSNKKGGDKCQVEEMAEEMEKSKKQKD